MVSQSKLFDYLDKYGRTDDERMIEELIEKFPDEQMRKIRSTYNMWKFFKTF